MDRDYYKKSAFDIARHAYKTVPLYYQLAEKKKIDIDNVSFDDLPIVDKKAYIESGMACISSKYISDYLANKLIWTRTSGSTGKYTEVYWNKEQENLSLLELWMLRKRYYNILPRNRLCYFYPSDEHIDDIVKKRYLRAYPRISILDDRKEQIYEDILSYDPEWMIVQPSIALLLVDLAEKYNRTPENLRYIEFTGEYLEPKVRRRVETVFDCRTANQYGTKEVNSIAYECPAGNLHILSQNVYVENIPGNYGDEICVTTLKNRVMPLVRFNVEDRGKIKRNIHCACGQCGDVLSLEAGRHNSWIHFGQKEKLHPYILIQIINEINNKLRGAIIQCQIIQEAYEVFLIEIVLDEQDSYGFICEEINKKFREKLGDVQINIEQKNTIMPNPITGKLASFVWKGDLNDDLLEGSSNVN